jgi:hypothetical protein
MGLMASDLHSKQEGSELVICSRLNPSQKQGTESLSRANCTKLDQFPGKAVEAV